MKDEFRRLFNELPIGAVVLTPDQEIRYANPAFEDYLGYPASQLEGRSLFDLTSEYDRGKLERGLEELYSRDRRYLELETCYIREDGEEVWGYPVRMLHPNPATDEQDSMLMLVVDITERRRLEERLRRSERMSSLGLLAGSIAHDFNNILTVVTTFVGLLESESVDSELVDEGIENIRNVCERGQELTRQLLEFGRRESSSVEIIDINEFVRDIAKMFRRVLPSSMELELSLSDEPSMVMTEEGRLHQVLMNLVLNARDAIESEGTITISTRPVDSEDSSVSGSERLAEGHYTRLRVCDSGPGISEDLVPKIFEPYFTTKEQQGTGLGLTTVYGIVEEDKGYIRVDTAEGKGTCFDIFFPASRSARELSDDRDEGGSRLVP